MARTVLSILVPPRRMPAHKVESCCADTPDSSVVEARLLLFWEATFLHAFPNFQSRLLQSSISQPPLQVSPVDIRFIDLTKFVEIPLGPSPLPLELFRFMNNSWHWQTQIPNFQNYFTVYVSSWFDCILPNLKAASERPFNSFSVIPEHVRRSTIVRLSVFDVQASQLHQKLDDVGVKPKVIIAMSTNQMLKVCMSINSIALAEMEFPQAYLEALPENGRPCLGDFLIETSRLITSQQITCLDGSSHKNNRSSNQSLYFNVVSGEILHGKVHGNQARKLELPRLWESSQERFSSYEMQYFCKSRGVPAAKRRERQAQLAGLPTKRSREASSVGVKPKKPLKPLMDGTTFPAPNVQGSFSEDSGVLRVGWNNIPGDMP
ncbi:hypothetical protein HID58_017633 [Brassica napus]|uniref:PRONE domain-containing protein n=1 Tax=Brassica napus TaxID=3708 RepID=A0ABQ8D7N9_BRANA|nr:hypothetical protein HID58_017633 [Brassica napus]